MIQTQPGWQLKPSLLQAWHREAK